MVLSAQHSASVEQEQLRRDLTEQVIRAVIPAGWLDERTKMYINPTGRFEVGGPQGDSGPDRPQDHRGHLRRLLPARGGGCFSGKDPTKVDRSASYMARYICKNVVKAGLCDRCELQVAYAIGVAKPVSLYVNTFGTAKIPRRKRSPT